jgi:thioredoxin 1
MSRLHALLTALFMALFAAPVLAAMTWTTYAPQPFAAAQEAGRTVLVHVTAPWCPTCRAQKPILDELRADAKLADMVFVTLDYDSQKDFLRAHQVRGQSTIIVFKGRQEVNRVVAETGRDRLRAFVYGAAGVPPG